MKSAEERRAYRRKYYLAVQQGTERFRAQCRYHRRRHYIRHKQAVLADSRRRAAETKELLDTHKSQPCADCGMCYPPYVMDLDHVRGLKIAHLGSGRFKQSLRQTIEEAEKCDVVCANCHREREQQKRLKTPQKGPNRMSLTLEPIPELSLALRQKLDVILSVYASRVIDLDILTAAQNEDRLTIGRVLSEAGVDKASADAFTLCWVRGAVTSKLDKKKLIAQGVTTSQLEAATVTKPKRDYFMIRGKNEKPFTPDE